MSEYTRNISRKIALILGLFALLLWTILGTGTSLAWFYDETPKINNIFHFADFDVEVSYLAKDGNWKSIEGSTEVFDNNALYEPGYVQVVYLKVTNAGDRDFKFLTAVNVHGCSKTTNVFGQTFWLKDYLMFGVLPEIAEGETVSSRERAIEIADKPLCDYSYYETGALELAPGQTKYLAVVVRMPDDVNNIANFEGEQEPKVELGITVKAEQIGAD